MLATLHVFDFDGTLYRSTPPPGAPDHWWHDASSLDALEGPGFDPNWNLAMVAEARHGISDPLGATVLITGRPDYAEMRDRVTGACDLASIPFDRYYLRRAPFTATTAEYKAASVLSLLAEFPSFVRVVMWDDELTNLVEVKRVVEANMLTFEGRHVRPLN